VATEKTVLIDGTSGDCAAVSEAIASVLAEGGADVRIFSGNDLRMTNCIGCFGCWLETPGLCRFKEPAAQALLAAYVQSDTVVLLAPVALGGYAFRLKQVVDRTLPILLPYMSRQHGEVHHLPRYAKRPRLVVIGVQEVSDRAEADTFRLFAGRHAIDVHVPSYAAEVVSSGADPDRLRETFRAVLARHDKLPLGKAIEGAAPGGGATIDWGGPDNVRRAFLMVGSPKTRSPSTSGVLGNGVLDRLRERGWETETHTLKATSFTAEGEAALLAAVDQADLLLFAFPLYVDALPSLLPRAIQRIAARRAAGGGSTAAAGRPLGLAVIINNGFPESYQDNVALAICKHFADAAGMVWLGGFAMGSGESVVSGRPLDQPNDMGIPLMKIQQALGVVAEALDQGRAIPREATKKLAGGPIPSMPFFVWRLMVIHGSKAFWEKRAASNGVDKQAMLVTPYAGKRPAEGVAPVLRG
jgi:multimeric flavodoxin WrbA